MKGRPELLAQAVRQRWATRGSVYDGTSLEVTKGLRGSRCRGSLWLLLENRSEGTQRPQAVRARTLL